MEISSRDFDNGAVLPSKCTCDGNNISPHLHWHNVPVSAKSLALIMNDPDAPGKVWTHWVLYNLPVSCCSLEENAIALPAGSKTGINSWGRQGYGGPCLPTGKYRYYFTLYALDVEVDAPEILTSDSLFARMEGHILGKSELFAWYERKIKSK
jgi:hypothetical protein